MIDEIYQFVDCKTYVYISASAFHTALFIGIIKDLILLVACYMCILRSIEKPYIYWCQDAQSNLARKELRF